MAPLSFAQNDHKLPATEGKSLFNVADHRDLCTCAGYTVSFAENPHEAGSVVNLKNAAAHGSERVRDMTSNSNFFSRVSPRVLIDLRDAFAWRAARQKRRKHN